MDHVCEGVVTPGDGFTRVANALGLTPEQLRYAMDDVGRARGVQHITVSVRPVRYGRMAECRPGTVVWELAELLHVEPEEIRDAVVQVYHVDERGKRFGITHRVRKESE